LHDIEITNYEEFTVELIKNIIEIGRSDGSLEHGIFVREDQRKPMEHLVHLSISPLGHATVIDPHEHPHYHPELDNPPLTPEAHANRVKKFLDLDGHKFLGHPKLPETTKAEVARLKTKYKIA
jgi:hypothetical protein